LCEEAICAGMEFFHIPDAENPSDVCSNMGPPSCLARPPSSLSRYAPNEKVSSTPASMLRPNSTEK
jgi:hypothetical protein